MIADTTVKYYDYSMFGAFNDLRGNAAGGLISILDSCLQNGFGSVNIDSLVVANNVATATVNSGHNFAMIGNIGPVVTINGVSIPSALNREWRIASTPSSTVFTFITEGIANQTASGTITAKRSPAGWTKVYSGTNKAVYRANYQANGDSLYLRVSDEGLGATSYARVRGYESMSDVDTGTGPFPTDAQVSGGLYWSKSIDTSSTVRKWQLVADHLGFCYINSLLDYYKNPVWFGYINSHKLNDVYGSLIVGGDSNSLGAMGALCDISTSTSFNYLPRSYTFLATSIGVRKSSHASASNYTGNGPITIFPSPVNNGLYIAPIDILESNGYFRGTLPGVYCPLHTGTVLTEGPQTDILGLPGHTIYVFCQVYNSCAIAIDITGPWR